MKRILCLLSFWGSSLGMLLGQGTTGGVKGTVKDASGKPVPFANVVLLQGTRQVAGAPSDFEGIYSMTSVPVGTYDMQVSAVGYTTKKLTNIVVSANKITFQDVVLTENPQNLQVVDVEAVKDPLIKKDEGTQGANIQREDVLKLPARDPINAALIVGGVNSNGSEYTLRGSRGSPLIFIDGVKIRGSANLPQQAIQEVQVILGGVPANLGDATGGIILMTTRGISPNWFGGFEARSSKFLDYYDNYLFQGNVGGPLLWRKPRVEGGAREPLVGFLLAGEGEYNKDPRPAFFGFYEVKPEVRNRLLANPLQVDATGTGTNYSSQFLRRDDFNVVRTRTNSWQYKGSLTAKLDFALGPKTTFTVGGNGNYFRTRDVSYANQPLNWQNAGIAVNYDYNVYAKFIQRFQADKESKGAFRSAFFSLQGDYSFARSEFFDPRHRSNLWNYGYVGRFNVLTTPTFSYGLDESTGVPGWRYQGDRDVLVQFTPSNLNPELAAYTQAVYNLYSNPFDRYDNFNSLIKNLGLRNGDQPNNQSDRPGVYTIFNNPGHYFNSYGYGQNTQFRLLGMGAVELKNHNITLGFEFEQRRDSRWSLAPGAMWNVGRQLINRHIREIDYSNPLFVYDENGVYQDTILYNRLYSADGHAWFDKSVRRKLGLDEKSLDFIPFDALDPSFYDITMFSPDELLNNGSMIVNYYGYDPYGKPLKGRPSLSDFFNKKDANGNFMRSVAAFQPVYFSGYIMDKFTFRDLVFNAGVRVDRFDANQRVLKDPYTLYAARTAGEVKNVQHPSNIGDDYVVYVNTNQAGVTPTILGYRKGDTWFNSEGQQINDIAPLRATNTGDPIPYLVNPNESVRSGNFNVDASFGDYKPQVNVMPRIAFSFPISDVSLFTAHYDVLVQRPFGGVRLDPFDFFFWDNPSYPNSASNPFNNPALRPEKTIDYSLGFQQQIGDNSAIKITAYYREIRDQINVQRVTGAYPRDYFTYQNVDLGTTKGLTLTYDLRRTGNVRLTASYTLQYADGTYADQTSSVNLNAAGFTVFRVPVPLRLDQRHFFNLFIDYSYGEGKAYNGPRIGKSDIFSNAGITATMFGGSGFPYSRSLTLVATQAASIWNRYVLDGSIHGSRLPWQFNVDLRVYKQWKVNFRGRKGNESGNRSVVEAYLQVLNLFNFKNVINVYRYTGNPSDDGYLTDANSQSEINNTQPSSQSYRDMYAMAVRNPYNWSLPRRTRLGVIVNF